MNKKLNCIMVIDDDEPTNYMSALLIDEAACTLHLEIIDSGRQAINYLKNLLAVKQCEEAVALPDLIFLDINMPCMNGWEFVEEYKKINRGRLPSPVIIMLTTSLSPDDKQRAESTPEITGFENKPLTNEMIERLIKTHFSGKANMLIQQVPVRQ